MQSGGEFIDFLSLPKFGEIWIINRPSSSRVIFHSSMANLATHLSNRTLRTNRREVGDRGDLGPEIENSDRDLHFGLIIYSKNLQN